MPMFLIRDDSGNEKRVVAASILDARVEARGWWLDGVSYEVDLTTWVDAYVWELDADGVPIEPREVVTVAIDPPAPRCRRGREHEWESPHSIVGGLEENPGVLGHGGGVVVTEVCVHCGTASITDTWAQRPDTGEQGLQSVCYEANKYEDEVRVLAEKEDRE